MSWSLRDVLHPVSFLHAANYWQHAGHLPADLGSALDAAGEWDRLWPGFLPSGLGCPAGYPSARIHAWNDTLRPRGGRTEQQAAAALHESVLRSAATAEDRLLLITFSWAWPYPWRRPRPVAQLRFIEQAYWRTCESWGLEPGDFSATNLHVSWTSPADGALARVFDLVGNDEVRVLVAPADLRWVMRPYEGGIDVWAHDQADVHRFEAAGVAAGGEVR